MLEFRSLREYELNAWHDHCMLVFNKGVVNLELRQMFADSWYHDPSRGLEEILVAVEDGELLSGLRVVRRQIYLQGEAVGMGGIAFVSTKPEARGRGLSTRLLRDAITLMDSWGLEVSMLATDLFSFYARLGWEQVVFQAKILKLAPVQPPAGLRARPLDFDRDLPAVMALYDQTARRLNGTLARGEAYWDQFLRGTGGWWVAEREGAPGPAACLRLSGGTEAPKVIEFSALEPDAELFDGLLCEALRQENRPVETILCPGPVPTRFETLETHAKDYLMLRCNRPFHAAGAWVADTAALLRLIEDHPAAFWESDGF
jgi:GNAT superfamily N-acetyltransferase